MWSRIAAKMSTGRGSVAAAHVEALLAQLEQTSDPTARSKILVEVGIAMRDDLGDEDQAIDALLEAWRWDPRNDPVLDHLEPLLTSHGRWTEALETTQRLFSQAEDGRRAIAFAEGIVRWLTRYMPNADLARQWVERIRILDSTHALVHMLQAAVSREHGDFKRELDELDLAVLSTRRADERLPIHLLMASRYLEERTLNLAAAKKHYASGHKLFPRSMDPLRGLENVALIENDNKALADVLRKQAEADVDDQSRITILLRLARLEEAEFRKPDLAAKTLERVIAIDPIHDQALEALERCYRAARMWNELAGVLERSAIADRDAETRAGRLKRLGDVLESKLGDVRSALTTYQRLAGLLPEDETVVGELARLAEKVNDMQLAVNCRERLAELTNDPTMRARHHVVAGQLLVPVDAVAARRHFERAVAADPTNASAWNALLWDARAESDHARVARYLEEKANATDTPRARATAFVELAELRARLGDKEGERRAWEQAIASDPSNETAASALMEAFVAEGRYAEVEVLCTAVIEAATRDKDPPRLYTARRAQSKAATMLGKPDVALIAALAAFEARREAIEGRELLVRAAADMRADPAVLTAKDALITISDNPEGLTIDGRVALASVLSLIGENDRAAVLYDDVLSEKADDDRALAGLAQHHAASGNKVASLSLKRQIARNLSDPGERLETLLETAEAFAKAGNDDLAADVFEEARREQPRSLPILHKLLAVYQKTEKWQKLFDVLRSIAEVDADPVRRAKTYFTMGQLASLELMDRGTALEMFEKSLDIDPSQLEGFERIVSILTQAKDWLGLEVMYKRMINRAIQGNDVILQHALYKQIGIVYRDRLHNAANAIHCFQIATQLRQDDEQAQAMLRELLARTGQAAGAVSITFDRILRDPLDPAPYPALFDLLAQQHARDRALCVASAMNFLDIAHPAAQGLRASFPQPPVEAIVLDLGPEGYRELLHQDLDPALTEIFEVVAVAVVDIALSRLNLRERLGHPGPSLKGHDWLVKVVARAAHVLGAHAPKLYLRRVAGPAFGPAATKPPSLFVYPPALAGVSRDVLAFLLGKRIMDLTPPLFARALCPSISELKGLAASAARITTNQMEPGDMPLRERMKKDDIARVAAAVDASMSRSGKLDVLRWSQLADVSSSRAGLLLAGDLEAARAAIAIEAQAPGDLTPREKMKELVAWFLGDASAALRRRLGVALA